MSTQQTHRTTPSPVGVHIPKLDLRTQYRSLYHPSSRQPEIVDVPELKFLMIDGHIEAGQTPDSSPAFRNAIQALYGVGYTLKFMSKLRKVDPIDYPVIGLEAIWWVDDGQFDLSRPDNWLWRAMIMQPAHISDAMVDEARATLGKKKPDVATDGLRLETYREGLCVQMLHVGPYANEPATVARMQAFAADLGLRERFEQTKPNGEVIVRGHHEIYLSDPRRCAPEKLKTVVRHPVVAARLAV